MSTSLLDTYLATARPAHRAALRVLHDTIAATLPEADLVLRRGVPAFRYRSKPLVSIGDAQGHVALYVMQGAALIRHATELRALSTSRTVVRFEPSSAIPTTIVTQLVRTRAEEIDGHASTLSRDDLR